MSGFWAVLVATKQAELDQRPWDMRLHLAAELTTALLLVVSGAGTLLGVAALAAASPVALGMLLYTVINSPGFYAGRRNLPMVGMFTVLAVVTAAAVASLILLG